MEATDNATRIHKLPGAYYVFHEINTSQEARFVVHIEKTQKPITLLMRFRVPDMI